MQIKYPFEISSLKGSNVPLSKVKMGDIVRIKDSELDGLRDFYNGGFDGNPLKLFSGNFAIDILNDIQGAVNKNEHMILLVRAIDSDKFIQVDLYHCDIVIFTIVLDNATPKIKVANGRFYTEAYSIERNLSAMNYLADPEKNHLTMYISDIVSYVLYFMQENLDNPQYVTKTTNTHTESTAKKKKKNAKSKKRSTIYIPKKKFVKEETEKENTAKETKEEDSAADSSEATHENDKKTKRSYCGHIEEWKARGHKRKIVSKKTGEVRYVDVKPSVRKRNPKLMSKGQDNGADIRLIVKK